MTPEIKALKDAQDMDEVRILMIESKIGKLQNLKDTLLLRIRRTGDKILQLEHAQSAEAEKAHSNRPCRSTRNESCLLCSPESDAPEEEDLDELEEYLRLLDQEGGFLR